MVEEGPVTSPEGARKPRRPATRRAERRAFRREEILRTAEALVAEGGLDAVTTTELARRTGAALGALYRFFPSKAAVIAALQREAIAALHTDLVGTVDAAVARAGRPRVAGAAALIAIADVVFTEPRAHPARFRLIDEALSRLEPIYEDADARSVEEALQPLVALAARQLEAFAAAVPADDLARVPFVLWAGLHGVTHFIKRDRLVAPGLQSPRLAATTVRLLLRGLGATDDEIAAAIAAAAPVTLAF